MDRLRRLMRLPGNERWLLLRAAMLLLAVRLGLWLLPFQTLRRALAGLAAGPSGARGTKGCFEIGVTRAVETAARYLPYADTCLTKALTAQVLLKRRGYPTLLRIGVAKSNEGRLEAHAWLESGDEVIFGEYELEQYTSLAALQAD